MKTKNNLNGKWRFVAAEKHNGEQWLPSQNYVKEMTWELFPEYFSEKKIVGNIVESSPANTPINLSYSYLVELAQLTIETSTNHAEADIYQVEIIDEQQITISIINEPEQEQQYFRYTLQREE